MHKTPSFFVLFWQFLNHLSWGFSTAFLGDFQLNKFDLARSFSYGFDSIVKRCLFIMKRASGYRSCREKNVWEKDVQVARDWTFSPFSIKWVCYMKQRLSWLRPRGRRRGSQIRIDALYMLQRNWHDFMKTLLPHIDHPFFLVPPWS